MMLAVRPAEAARMLGVSPRTMHRWLRERRLASHREGRVRMIPLAEVQRIAEGDPRLDPMRAPTPKPAVRISAWARKTLHELRR